MFDERFIDESLMKGPSMKKRTCCDPVDTHTHTRRKPSLFRKRRLKKKAMNKDDQKERLVFKKNRRQTIEKREKHKGSLC